MANIIVYAASLLLAFASCSGRNSSAEASSASGSAPAAGVPAFSADSACKYLSRQVEFGPRVPNTEAHTLAADWLVSELKRHGAEVTEQRADLRAFDGTILHARNIFGRINPDADRRILLLAHYDCRPWADEDPDPAKRRLPVDGANDGASGVAVILEAARQLKAQNSPLGVDFLFVDAEDWGTENDELSWAMGARHFVKNPPVENFAPDMAVLLDMVGGEGARFPREYFSQQAAPALADAFWAAAAQAGHGALFPNEMGGAVTDDHIQLIEAGIPAIDVIEYHRESGFNPHWHTTSDNLSNISKQTLKAVGESLMMFLENQK